jgi:hypothetical protein
VPAIWKTHFCEWFGSSAHALGRIAGPDVENAWVVANGRIGRVRHELLSYPIWVWRRCHSVNSGLLAALFSLIIESLRARLADAAKLRTDPGSVSNSLNDLRYTMGA